MTASPPTVSYTHLDVYKRQGLFNERVNASVKETDRWISMLWNAAAETGLENDTDIIILSDHGQLGISRTVCPNVFLRDAGYIQADEQDHLVSWDAYALSCGLSAQVYLSLSLIHI